MRCSSAVRPLASPGAGPTLRLAAADRTDAGARRPQRTVPRTARHGETAVDDVPRGGLPDVDTLGELQVLNGLDQAGRDLGPAGLRHRPAQNVERFTYNRKLTSDSIDLPLPSPCGASRVKRWTYLSTANLRWPERPTPPFGAPSHRWHDACETPACRSGLPISLVALLVIEYHPLALRWTGRKELDPERANY